MSDFFGKLRDCLDRGVEISKEAIQKAGETVQKASDRSVTLMEIHQLENKLEKEFTKLGKVTSESFLKGNASVSSSDEDVAVILKEIESLKADIAKRKESEKTKEASENKTSSEDNVDKN